MKRATLTVAGTVLLCVLRYASTQDRTDTVAVTSGFELHTALASPQIKLVYLANNVVLTPDTCPFPAADIFSATVLNRNITIASALLAHSTGSHQQQPPGAPATQITAAGPRLGPPYAINCNFLTDRFRVESGVHVTLSNLILINCRTYSIFGFFRKLPGSTLILDHVVDQRASVCQPLQLQYSACLEGEHGKAIGAGSGIPVPLGQVHHYVALTPTNESWCSSAAAAAADATQKSNGTILANASPFDSPVPANDSSPLCHQQALLLLDVAIPQAAASGNSSSTQNGTYTLKATNTAVLCPQPVSSDCVCGRGSPQCLAQAYEAVNPDTHKACPATDGYTFHSCLADAAFKKVIVLQPAIMNVLTSPATQQPILIGRNVTIMSDPRGPRLTWDCGLLSNRFQLQPGHTLTLFHIILTNCTSTRFLSFVRLSAESELVVNDTFVVQAPGLCLPVDPEPVDGVPVSNGIFTHYMRPDDVPGVQSFAFGQPGQWCSQTDSGVRADDNAKTADNSSYQEVGVSASDLGMFANTTGLGPASAATLAAPATVPYYVNPTWPSNQLCTDTSIPPPLLLRDFASGYTAGWVDGAPVNATEQQGMQQILQELSNVSATSPRPDQAPDQQDQQQAELPMFGSDLDQINGSYSGTVMIWYINSALLCPMSLTSAEVAAGCLDPSRRAACQAAAYAAVNPDRQMVPGAAAYEAAKLSGADRTAAGAHGVQVVLPALLGAIGGATILIGLLAALIHRHHRQEAAKAAPTTAAAAQAGATTDCRLQSPVQQSPQHKPGVPMSWVAVLGGGGTSAGGGGQSSRGSSDMGRYLLGTSTTPRTPTTVSSARTPHTGHAGLSTDIAPEGIQLSVLLGAGSFGRVYAGTWLGKPVAVKVVTHSSADAVRIAQELALSLSFDHPNLVRALHYTKIRIKPTSPHMSEADKPCHAPKPAAESYLLRRDKLGVPSDLMVLLPSVLIDGGSDLFLPQGAVGVFKLPSNWAVVQRTQAAAAGSHAPAIDTETWIVMDLMDRGNLAAALRHGTAFTHDDGSLNMARILRRAADVLAGLAYLHSRNVCHGDLKWENVLLKTEARDPDGLMAKVADFGLSRALAYGQSHLSTRRYGTVTHMPPELLVAGKLTPAVDIYSFGIMMWELVTRSLPFQGLHHGEIIHKVVTEDLRPGPWPVMPPGGHLPADYIPLAEACWSRNVETRPSATELLQRLLIMLSEVEAEDAV